MLVAAGGAAVSVPLAKTHAVLASHVPGWSLRSGALSACPGGERNALEAECLTAVTQAAGEAGRERVQGLTRVQSKTAPAGCSYNIDTETAVFNSEAVGRGHAGCQLVCHAVSEIQLWRWPWDPEQEEQQPQEQAHAQQEEQPAQQAQQEQQAQQAQLAAKQWFAAGGLLPPGSNQQRPPRPPPSAAAASPYAAVSSYVGSTYRDGAPVPAAPAAGAVPPRVVPESVVDIDDPD